MVIIFFLKKIFNKIFYDLGYPNSTRRSFETLEYSLRLKEINIIAPQSVSVLTYKNILLENFKFLKNYEWIALYELTILFFYFKKWILKIFKYSLATKR